MSIEVSAENNLHQRYVCGESCGVLHMKICCPYNTQVAEILEYANKRHAAQTPWIGVLHTGFRRGADRRIYGVQVCGPNRHYIVFRSQT